MLATGPDGQVDLVSATGKTPESLSATIGSRLRFLPEDTLRALRSVALLGGEFSVAQWATVTGQSTGQIAVDLERAVAGGVLEAGGERLRFRHDLIRQVLVEQIPASMRAVVQGDFARQLAGAGFDIDVVARQLLAARDWTPPWVVAWLAQLPESQLYPTLDVSAQLLRRARASVTTSSPEWQPIAVRLAQVLFWLGQRDGAGPVAEDVVAHTSDPGLSARMRVIAARCALSRGDYPHALQLTTMPDPALPDGWRATLLAWHATALQYLGKPEQAYDRAMQSLHLAQQSGDALSIGYARHVLIAGARHRGEFPDVDLDGPPGTDPESLELYSMLLCNVMVLQFMLGERAAFERTEARWLAFATRIGFTESPVKIGGLTELWYEYGRWDDVLVYTDSLVGEIVPGSGVYAPRPAFRVAVRREQPQLAARYLHAAHLDTLDTDTAIGDHPPGESTSSPRSPNKDLELCDVRAVQAAARGDRAAELYWRRQWLTAPRWAQIENWENILRLLCVALELDESATVAAVLELCREAPDIVSWRLVTRCCRALVDNDTAELLALAEEFRDKGWTLVQVEILEEAAVRLAHSGNTNAARTAFADTIAIYDGLAASLDIRRVSARIRPYGIRLGPHSRHRRASTGWAALTPAEQRIAHLAANGLSNPDIAHQLYLSRNTVQSHVSSILNKLQLRSRVQLPDAVPHA
jgi:DNA-binding CsgD family transcriptional regulator